MCEKQSYILSLMSLAVLLFDSPNSSSCYLP
jgi:hypothetical protein